MANRPAVAVLVAGVLAVAGAAPAAAQLPDLGGTACPAAPDAAKLPSAAQLRSWNRVIDHGVRPTGSPAQARYIDWIRNHLRDVPGVKLSELRYTISRFTPSSVRVSIRVGQKVRRIAVAGPVPYSKPTGRRGVSAPLAIVADGQEITAANSRGKLVLRHAPAGSVPNADFLLPVVGWGSYDPEHTVDPTANFYGDFINYNARVADLRAARAAGAKGVLFYKDLPNRQLKDHYEPYEGSRWQVPGAYLGADQGKLIQNAVASGQPASARITLRARYRRVTTPTVIATVAGRSPQRLVVDSHTDGTNAAEDNGPVAMVGMARYFAGLPAACRPRTLQFVFTTAHFYQRLVDPNARHGGSGQIAKMLDADYDRGTVAGVVVLEHLGARSYTAVPRRDGGPGAVLRLNGLREIQFVAVTASAPLVRTVDDVVKKYDMKRTIELQGADAPGATVPSHCSFGGEGTPYNQRLLPTVASIAAPQSLYDPAFGLRSIHFGVMHSEMLGYTELLNRMGTMSRQDIAGQVTVDRQRRAAGGQPCPNEN
jgi:hypothetical protein